MPTADPHEIIDLQPTQDENGNTVYGVPTVPVQHAVLSGFSGLFLGSVVGAVAGYVIPKLLDRFTGDIFSGNTSEPDFDDEY